MTRHPRKRLRVERLEDRAVPAGAGTLDTTFGTAGGLVTVGAGTEDMAVTPDDKVYTLAYNGANGVLTRLLPNGQPDPSFHRTGQLTLGFDVGSMASGRLILMPDGSVTVLGESYVAGAPTSNLIEFRVSADGNTVSTRGTAEVGFGPPGDAFAFADLYKLVATVDPAPGTCM